MRSVPKLLCVPTLLLLADCQSVETPDDGRDWGDAEHIGIDASGTFLRPDVAVGLDGDAVAVWHGGSPPAFSSQRDIRSNRYTPTDGWGMAERIEEQDAGNATAARVAMDGDGNGIAVWQQADGTFLHIWSNRYTPTDGWGMAERIDIASGNARRPEVAMDSGGRAIAVWYQSEGTREDIWSNRYTPSEGWARAERIENNEGDSLRPQLAMDPSGNAMVVWQQFEGADDASRARPAILSRYYTPTGGWGRTQPPVTRDDAGDASRPHVAMDARGHAVAVWQESDGTLEHILSNRYVAGVGWGAAARIEDSDAGDALKPQVAMDPEGNAVAVWQQFDGKSDGIWSKRYGGESEVWSGAERIDGNDPRGATSPKVAMDAGGTAVVVWTQPDDIHISIWSNRYNTSFGWGTPGTIEDHHGGRGREPEVAMDPNGNAVAVWSQRVGQSDEIWSNRLTWRDPG